MAEYINKQEILNEFKKFPTDKGTFALANWFYQAVKSTPAADVVPVERSGWIIHSNGNGGFDLTCPRCGLERTIQAPRHYVLEVFRFCSRCGTKMDDMEEVKVKPKESPKYLPGVEMYYENSSTPVSSLRLPNVDEVAARFGLQRKNGETNNELYGRILHELLQNPYLDEEPQNADPQ